MVTAQEEQRLRKQLNDATADIKKLTDRIAKLEQELKNRVN
jgi:hypothetical protein